MLKLTFPHWAKECHWMSHWIFLDFHNLSRMKQSFSNCFCIDRHLFICCALPLHNRDYTTINVMHHKTFLTNTTNSRTDFWVIFFLLSVRVTKNGYFQWYSIVLFTIYIITLAWQKYFQYFHFEDCCFCIIFIIFDSASVKWDVFFSGFFSLRLAMLRDLLSNVVLYRL